MVPLSVAVASRQSKYPTKLFDTGISFLKMMLNPVQLGMVCGSVDFLVSIISNTKPLGRQVKSPFRHWNGRIKVLGQQVFQIRVQPQPEVKKEDNYKYSTNIVLSLQGYHYFLYCARLYVESFWEIARQ